MEERVRSGRCGCGAVRLRMRGEPIVTHCCHCPDCQRQTGSAFVLNAVIETSALEIQGEVAETPMPTDSGRPHIVHRCAACGTALMSDYGGRPGIRFVRVGTLDEPHSIAPDVHIYTRSKVPWLALPADVPAHEAFYDPRTFWTAEMGTRWRAAVAG